MIRIVRPPASPEVLAALEPGVQEIADIVAKIELDCQAGHIGSTFEFKGGIYGHKAVKDALIAFQQEKCAYCEGKFSAFSYGDTEHYRPKAYSQQRIGGPTIRPGYFWLAYQWNNLAYSCEKCNRSRKRNVFPLLEPTSRARTPADNVDDEDPLLLDPTGPLDPAEHIHFNGAVPEGLTDVGRTTIELYHLARIPLNAARLAHLKMVNALCDLVTLAAQANASALAQQYGAAAEAELGRMTLSNAVFSAMTRDYLSSRQNRVDAP